MMKRSLIKSVFVAAVVLCSVSFVFAEGSAEKPAESDEPIVIQFGDYNVLGGNFNLNAEYFIEEVKKELGDKVEIRYFPGAQLGSARELIESVQLNQLDMSYADNAYLSNLVPEFSIFGLPYLLRDWDHAAAVMDGEVGKTLEEMLVEQERMRVIAWFHVGFRQMITIDKPVKSLADFKGMKFRSPEVPMWINMFRALGAVPTPVPWAEVYTAMKTNLVEGMEAAPQAFVSKKLYEIAEYVTKTNHMYVCMALIVNEDSWQSYPKAVQQGILRAAERMEAKQRKEMIAENEGGYDVLVENGMTILDIDKGPLQEAVGPVWEQFKKDAPKAEEMIEIISKM